MDWHCSPGWLAFALLPFTDGQAVRAANNHQTWTTVFSNGYHFGRIMASVQVLLFWLIFWNMASVFHSALLNITIINRICAQNRMQLPHNFFFLKCGTEMLESARKFWKQQRQLPAFPLDRKSRKPISRNYAWKTACCLNFQVAHAVKESVAWSHHSTPPACSFAATHRESISLLGLMIREAACCVTGRSGDHLLHRQEFCYLLW